jgi:hypothetical protein
VELQKWHTNSVRLTERLGHQQTVSHTFHLECVAHCLGIFVMAGEYLHSSIGRPPSLFQCRRADLLSLSCAAMTTNYHISNDTTQRRMRRWVSTPG